MNFFENQARAKRNTSLLVGLYILAVLCIICGTYFAFVLSWQLGIQRSHHDGFSYAPAFQLWHPDLFWGVSGITFFVVLFGSLIKLAQLSRGGESVARMLGGEPIFPNSVDPDEKKVLNVVEEMAIASGISVPRVFLLKNEAGINAFAAGLNSRDAVIGVTRGCITQLTRDELQGVIAHEFSHILNGDMRLNLKLIAMLGGIMIIAMSGYAIWRNALWFGPRYRSEREEGNSRGFLILFGLFLFLLGYIGAFFARIIKSAVSRQREFLADASAVQFTRNPSGLSHALQKIAGFAEGSKLESSSAEEASHMFFANGMGSMFLNLFATHPPLEERIRRIDPSARFEEVPRKAPSLISEASRNISLDAQAVSALVGAPTNVHLDYAKNLLESEPRLLREMTHEVRAAQAIVFSLLLMENPAVRDTQISYLKENCDSLVFNELERVIPLIAPLGMERRLPLVSATLPALSELPPADYRKFREILQYLVEADQNCSIFEYCLQRMLKRSLDGKFFGVSPRSTTSADVQIKTSALELLASLALLTQSNIKLAKEAFFTGAKSLGLSASIPDLKPEWGSLAVLDQALYNLENSSASIKETVLRACVACITSDRSVTVKESELLRAIADGLLCPLPPLHV